MAPRKKKEHTTALVLKKRKEKVTKAPVKKILKAKCSLKIARAQLVKECPVVIAESDPNTLLKKKRGRKKKLEEPETAEDVPKKKLKKTATAQVRDKNTKKFKVARAQLVKECPVVIAESDPNTLLKKKRGRKKKLEEPVARAQLVKECPVVIAESDPNTLLKKKRGRKKKLEEPVARAQLVKECPVVIAESDPNTLLKKKRGRKKKLEEPETAEDVPKKKLKKTATAQVRDKNTKKFKVARAQLVKECPVVIAESDPNTLLKKKRGRKKKLEEPVARAQLVKECPVVIAESDPNTLLKKKRGRKKKLEEPVARAQLVKECPVVIAESDPNTLLKKKRGRKKKLEEPVEPLKQKTPPKRKGRGRPPTQRKLKTEEDSTITSPSTLSGLLDAKISVSDSQNPVLKPSVDSTVNNSDSRRTSLTNASELSWTKDISGSSTTTCITVSSSDFVCIDGKLPELKLKKVDHVLNEEVQATTETNEMVHSLSEDSSSNSSSSSSRSGSECENTAVENTLNLSTSSISPILHSPTIPVDQSFDKNQPAIDGVTSILEILSPKLKSLNLSFPDIENENENFDMRPFEEKISVFLHEEYHTILECNILSQILSENCYVPKTNDPEIQQTAFEETDFAKPDLSVLSNKSFCDNRNDVSCGIARRRDTYDPCDDDDALSLFAESITGMDSSRLSNAASISCAAPNEYVPQPIVKRPNAAVHYQPTVINELKVNQIEAAITKTKPVYLKQNADSTSIHKEQELNCASNDNFAPINKTAWEQNIKPVTNTLTGNVRPRLTISCYKYPPFTKSVTLQGVCFFNLIDSCSKMDMCPFPHRLIEEQEFKERLTILSEEQFFQEYSLIAKWPRGRRKYVKCFADECQRRELPKILVEIVVDYLSKTQRSPEDAIIKVELVESALMYLNSWDLSVCEQLLKCNVGSEVLCDVFMKIIADTPNFSRFKNVFINLADFMVRVNRTFDLEVVSQILERVCILPFEAWLSASLISIIERTDRKIFWNNRMNWFEMMLNNFNKELCNRLLSIKMGSVTSEGSKPASAVSPPSLPSPCRSRELEPLIINQNSALDLDHRYTSPDTTNTDSVNKPFIIRTLNHLNPIRPNTRKPKQGPDPHNMFPRNWNQRSIMSRIPRIPYMRPQKRPMERPLPSVRPQFNFQRRYPDFYGSSS